MSSIRDSSVTILLCLFNQSLKNPVALPLLPFVCSVNDFNSPLVDTLVMQVTQLDSMVLSVVFLFSAFMLIFVSLSAVMRLKNGIMPFKERTAFALNKLKFCICVIGSCC